MIDTKNVGPTQTMPIRRRRTFPVEGWPGTA